MILLIHNLTLVIGMLNHLTIIIEIMLMEMLGIIVIDTLTGIIKEFGILDT